MDNAANVYMCNNLRLITNFCNNTTKIGSPSLKDISPGRGTVKIKLVIEDRRKDFILKLRNVIYVLNSLSNLVNLGLLNKI